MDVEDYLEQSVKNAILTVPTYFNDSQRKSIKDAQRIEGIGISFL